MINMDILESDTVFTDSPDTGDAKCLCSRCGKLIPGSEPAIRCWPDHEGERVQFEYRFHISCLQVEGGE
jgi:hypothetical protein